MAKINTLEDLVHGPVRIICEEAWAKNYPAEIGPPKYSHINFDHMPGHHYEQWIIEKFEEGYTIRNVGTHYWAHLYGEISATPDFDPKACKWYIESAGEGVYKIKVPNVDDVWTVRSRGPGFPKTVFADPANGEPNQLFSFEKA